MSARQAEQTCEPGSEPSVGSPMDREVFQRRYGAIVHRLGKEPDKRIALSLECASDTIGILRRRLGIPAFRKGRKGSA